MTSRLNSARWAALASIIAASVALVPGVANADDSLASPPGGEITLDVNTVNGSGCPAGSARVDMNPGNTGFKIRYDQFRAEAGGSASPTAFRKNCQVNLNVHIPQGFTFAVARADYWGRANLAPGAKALQRSNYYYQGSQDNATVEHVINGPINGTWRTTDVTATADLVWAPCGEIRNLNINTELVVSPAGSARNYISMRASDGEVYTLVNFQWREC